MKTKIFVLNLIAVTMTLFGTTGCSNEETAEYETTTQFENLKFVVNVNASGQMETRGATGKSSWKSGDKILAAIDKDNTNLCCLTYQGNGDWEVSKAGQKTEFGESSGSLAAVHADELNEENGTITTGGDVLYTQKGSYTRHNNVVEITLDMNQRPVSRIAIVGMDSACWIDGLTEFSSLKDISNMNWDSAVSSGSTTYKEVYGDTCVFYGIIKPNENGNTEVKLVNEHGATYVRTYSGKSMEAGDYIILQGPETAEADEWTSNVPVYGIEATKSEQKLMVGDEGSITEWYELKPNKPTNTKVTATSSNPNVLEISDDGKYKAKASGQSTIILTTDDGGYTCQFNIEIVNITDLVDFTVTGTSLTVSGGVYYGRQFTIYNNSDFEITVTELDGTLSGGKIIIPAHESAEVWNYYRVSGLYKSIKLVFTCNGKQYEKSKRCEI